MMRGMFAAISGLKVHQTMLDVTSNDIANVNTIGYKANRTTFSDSLSQVTKGATAPGGGIGGSNAAQVGLGVRLASIDNQMSSGSLQSTGNPLDVAIDGNGWFRLSSTAPAAGAPTPTQFSRAGNFQRDGQGYLVSQDGFYVVGKSAPGPTGTDAFIKVPDGATDIAVAANGAVTYVPQGGGTPQTACYLSVAKFNNDAGLERIAGNRWRANVNSGGEQASTPGNTTDFGNTVGGAIEMSNVDLASEFTNMITAQRGFQANSRVISTSDEMLQDLVNLKR